MESGSRRVHAALGVLAAGALAATVAFAGANAELTTGLANVETLIPGETARIAELRNEVQALAIDTGKSTTDITAGALPGRQCVWRHRGHRGHTRHQRPRGGGRPRHHRRGHRPHQRRHEGLRRHVGGGRRQGRRSRLPNGQARADDLPRIGRVHRPRHASGGRVRRLARRAVRGSWRPAPAWSGLPLRWRRNSAGQSPRSSSPVTNWPMRTVAKVSNPERRYSRAKGSSVRSTSLRQRRRARAAK